MASPDIDMKLRQTSSSAMIGAPRLVSTGDSIQPSSHGVALTGVHRFQRRFIQSIAGLMHPARLAVQILNGTREEVGIVIDLSQERIALATENPSHLSRGMVMIHAQRHVTPRANRARIVLSEQQGVELFERQPVLRGEMPLPKGCTSPITICRIPRLGLGQNPSPMSFVVLPLRCWVSDVAHRWRYLSNLNVVFRAVADHRFPVGRDALSDIGIGHWL